MAPGHKGCPGGLCDPVSPCPFSARQGEVRPQKQVRRGWVMQDAWGAVRGARGPEGRFRAGWVTETHLWDFQAPDSCPGAKRRWEHEVVGIMQPFHLRAGETQRACGMTRARMTPRFTALASAPPKPLHGMTGRAGRSQAPASSVLPGPRVSSRPSLPLLSCTCAQPLAVALSLLPDLLPSL